MFLLNLTKKMIETFHSLFMLKLRPRIKIKLCHLYLERIFFPTKLKNKMKIRNKLTKIKKFMEELKLSFNVMLNKSLQKSWKLMEYLQKILLILLLYNKIKSKCLKQEKVVDSQDNFFSFLMTINL